MQWIAVAPNHFVARETKKTLIKMETIPLLWASVGMVWLKRSVSYVVWRCVVSWLVMWHLTPIHNNTLYIVLLGPTIVHFVPLDRQVGNIGLNIADNSNLNQSKYLWRMELVTWSLTPNRQVGHKTVGNVSPRCDLAQQLKKGSY